MIVERNATGTLFLARQPNAAGPSGDSSSSSSSSIRPQSTHRFMLASCITSYRTQWLPGTWYDTINTLVEIYAGFRYILNDHECSHWQLLALRLGDSSWDKMINQWDNNRVLRTSLILVLIGLFSKASESQQPHILLIVADDYGWNDVGYHNPEMYTPTIDKLASAGVKLENYYVQPICTPSRSQLMSGKYQVCITG